MPVDKNYISKDPYVIVNKLKSFINAKEECKNINSQLATTFTVRGGQIADKILDHRSPFQYYRIGLQFTNGNGVWINDNPYNEKVNGKLKALTDRSGYKDVVISRNDSFLYLASPSKDYGFICEKFPRPTFLNGNVTQSSYYKTSFEPTFFYNKTNVDEINKSSVVILTWVLIGLILLIVIVIWTICAVKFYKSKKRNQAKEISTIDASEEFKACSVYNVAYASIDQVRNELHDVTQHTYETVYDVRNSNVRDSNVSQGDARNVKIRSLSASNARTSNICSIRYSNISVPVVEEGSPTEDAWNRNRHSSFMKPKKKKSVKKNEEEKKKEVVEEMYAKVNKQRK